MIPSGHFTGKAVCSIDVKLGFSFDDHLRVLIPQFHRLGIDFQHLDVGFILIHFYQLRLADAKLFNILANVFKPIVTDLLTGAVSDSVKTFLPELVRNISRLEFEIPNSGFYHTEISQAPWITKYGMILDMALYEGMANVGNTSPVTSISTFTNSFHETVRSRTSFVMARPTIQTALQGLITPDLLLELNPIILKAITGGVSTIELPPNTTLAIQVPFMKPIEIAMYNINISNLDWDQNISGLKLGHQNILVNAAFSADVGILMKSNSRQTLLKY